jgi:alkylation response protein AidB-like acyl-CoA dehydrogenase
VDFAFSDEQLSLSRAIRDFLQDRYTIERVAEIADSPGGFDRAGWKELAELGVASISVPEDRGGAGLSFLEEVLVSEETGRALYPGPFLASVVLALPILQAAGAFDLVSGIVSGERVATVAWAGEDGRFDVDPAPKLSWDDERLTATRLFVPSLGASDLLVIVGATPEGTGAWVVDRDAQGVAWRELPTVDRTRPMGEVVLQDVPATRLQVDDERFLDVVRDRALGALAAEAVGAASRALDLALEHVRTRQQFGRPIGAFQAVSHQLASAFGDLETARSLVYWAGWAVSEGAPEASVAAAAAKARAAEAATAACERAIQVHGGTGFTWEHPLHRFYKRTLAIGAYLGSGDELRARVASAILD